MGKYITLLLLVRLQSYLIKLRLEMDHPAELLLCLAGVLSPSSM